jgi:energy-coupling factor transport system ATP-binding protein
VQQVSYAYPGQPSAALSELSLRVRSGEHLVVIGHNGSGKSTLARLCGGLLLPDRGRVLIAGHDTQDVTTRRAIRDSIGMIFHNPDHQIIATVVEDDVAWGLAVRGYAAPLIRERVTAALAATGIAELRQLPPHQLSGGQRQRLAIAGVLALQPRCIIADESTAQLDPLSRQAIVALFHQLNQTHGLTIIQITHLLEEAALAERVVVMEQGRIVLEGAPHDIFADLDRLRRLRLAVPEPITLAARLRAAGLPIARSALTVEAIARELAP